MKKLLSVLLVVSMLLSGVSALAATHTATGEDVSGAGTSLSVYDVKVFSVIEPTQVFHGVKVADALPPKEALPLVAEAIAAEILSGAVTSASIAGVEALVGAELAAAFAAMPFVQQIATIMLAMDAPEFFDPATGTFPMGEGEKFTLDMLNDENAPLGSGFGYLVSEDGTEVPFVRITMEVVYADGNTYDESYVFTYAVHEDGAEAAWGLFSIIQFAPDFFEK